MSTAAKTVTLSEVTWSKFTALCCPDLKYTQTFTWNGHSFDAGPRQDVLHACAGAGSSLLTQRSRIDGAAGTSSMVLTFRNRLAQACTLTGYPGVDALAKSGVVLAHAKRTLRGNAGGASGVSTVRLAPGAAASATLEWHNFGANGSSCAMSASIVATPANTQDSTTLPVSVSVCGLQIHPTVAGSSGRS
ncbi:MAG: hypothetical protein DLM58_20690 [Pseudonocardiales bacterium]|nr:MAG: hypothetical protein DLM58_20690 [Pseudonocardiales bacterium]